MTTNEHTIADIFQSIALLKYELANILALAGKITNADDVDQCFDAVAELLEVSIMIRVAVESSVGAARANNSSPTVRPPAITQRSL